MNPPTSNSRLAEAFWFRQPGQPLERIQAPLPEPGPGEVLVKNLYTTLCGSDLHTYCGKRKEPSPVVLGHEIVGQIQAFGKASSKFDLRGNPLMEGDRVTWSIFSAPPGVQPPRPDLPQKTEGIFKYGHAQASELNCFNGGLAEFCLLKAGTAIIRLPEKIPLATAAPINCAHATVAGALRLAGSVQGKRVLVMGAGMLGLSCTAMCHHAEATWVGLADTNSNRLDWAKAFGATETLLLTPKEGIFSRKLPEVDLVFDMTGSALAMEQGLESLALGGTAIWIGAVYAERPVQVDAQRMVRKIQQIRGLHNYNFSDLVAATEFIENTLLKYPFERLVQFEYRLEESEKGFQVAMEQKPVRVGIRLEGE